MRAGSWPGSDVDACASGPTPSWPAGSRASKPRSPIQTEPLPPCPAEIANSMAPTCFGAPPGAPRVVEPRLPDGHPLPVAREDVVALVSPPDVLALGVDELELEVVGACVAAQAERERVVVRECEREGLPDDHVAAGGVEVEPDTHAGTRVIRLAGDPDVRALRRDRAPAGQVRKVVEHDAVGARRVRHDGQEHEEDRGDDAAHRYSFTPPLMMPAT